MKVRFLLVAPVAALLVFIFVTGSAHPEEEAEEGIEKRGWIIAIYGQSEGEAGGTLDYAYNRVISYLSDCKELTILDRNVLEQVISEQRLSISGFSNTFDIVELGRLDVASHLLGLKAGEFEGEVSLMFMLYDTSTGKQVFSQEYKGKFRRLDLPTYILADTVAKTLTGESLPVPDGFGKVNFSTGELDVSVRVLCDGKHQDGTYYVHGETIIIDGDKPVVQFFKDNECLFGFSLAEGTPSGEITLTEIPKHRLEAFRRDINMSNLSPLQNEMMAKYGLYGLLIFDMWVYRNMPISDIALFMNMADDQIKLFEKEFNDLEERLFGNM